MYNIKDLGYKNKGQLFVWRYWYRQTIRLKILVQTDYLFEDIGTDRLFVWRYWYRQTIRLKILVQTDYSFEDIGTDRLFVWRYWYRQTIRLKILVQTDYSFEDIGTDRLFVWRYWYRQTYMPFYRMLNTLTWRLREPAGPPRRTQERPGRTVWGQSSGRRNC